MRHEYWVRISLNGVYWDNSYTDSREVAEQWKKNFEDTSVSIYDRINGEALKQFIELYAIKDAETINVTCVIRKF